MVRLMMSLRKALPSLLALLLATSACAPAAAPAPAPAAPPAGAPAAAPTPVPPTPTTVVKKTGPLKIGVLGVVDMLPFYVAEQEGIWKAEGAQVELVPFRSAVERDTALGAGELDAVYSDLISLGLVNKERSTTKAALSIQKVKEYPMYSILAGANSGINTLADLKGKDLAVSNFTAIDYMVDRMLADTPIKPSDVKKVEVANMPARVELLKQGQLAAACLPEPLTTIAVAAGAKVLINDGGRPANQTVVHFTLKSLDEKADSIAAFVKGFEMASARVNANPEKYRDLLVKIAFVPAEAAKLVKVPTFTPNARVQTEEWTAVAEWLKARGQLKRELGYKDVITGAAAIG